MSPTTRRQHVLPGFRPGRGRLFSEATIDRYLTEHHQTPLPEGRGCAEAVRAWVADAAGSTAGERELDSQFASRVLCGVLGYVAYPTSPASLWEQPRTAVTRTRGTPDAILGEFRDDETICTAVVELKPPRTDLDRPQLGAAYRGRTPVDQAFDYGREAFGTRWIVVSDMMLIRLYGIESQDDYEEFDLRLCTGDDAPATEQLRRLHFLLHRQYLIDGHDQSQVARLYGKSTEQRVEVREGFYDAYRTIRSDVHAAIRDACQQQGLAADEAQLLEATQRLLDRVMFICYCEDHPQKLIEDGTLQEVTESAARLPGTSTERVYENLKALFREVDIGSPPSSGLHVAAYNGELFKEHPILDHITLPDALHRRAYLASGPYGRRRTVHGTWGLHVYDFWTELTEHLLGHVFEESLSDFDAIQANGGAGERKRHGVFFTTDIISEFLVRSALQTSLEEAAPLADAVDEDIASAIERRIERLLSMRVVDFACGSGAFLVSAYVEMARELRRLEASLDALHGTGPDLFAVARSGRHTEIMRDCIYGVDLLPQAAEIAKLALWLNSVRKDRPVADLHERVLATNSRACPIGSGRLM